MSDFTYGVFNGFDKVKNDMPLGPTVEQMQTFAEANNITTTEAWHRPRGERTVGRLALQAIAFGYTPKSFKDEFSERALPPGTAQVNVEKSKRAKQDAVSKMIRKCMNAIYNVASYSCFRDDLTDGESHRCIDPLDMVYSRPKDKWDRVILLALDQSKVKLPPVVLEMTKRKDVRAFARWNSILEDEQMKRLMDKYPDYGANVTGASNKGSTAQPSVAPEIEGPPSEAASSSHQNRENAQQPYPKGKGSKSGKGSKGQGATGRRIEWNHRSWNTYGTTFHYSHWNNPHVRDGTQSWGDYGYDYDNENDQAEEEMILDARTCSTHRV